MKIAQIAPLFESVPPKFYGGTERVVSYLTEELVRMGHDVTLFASGDSRTTAKLISPCRNALRLDKNCLDRQAPHILMLEKVAEVAQTFDILHSHIDFLPFPLFRRQQTPSVTTLHGRLDLPELNALFAEYRDMPLVSISNAQRRPVPWACWAETVYHGIPDDLFRPVRVPGRYLAFLGRLSVEKRVDRAVEIARRSKMPLRIAAKVDPVDQTYFKSVAEPLLSLPGVEFLGEIGENDKEEFLGNAAALLFPIDWPEPFGMVLIEAMACGTPIIAYGAGSVPEVVEDGVTGFIVKNVQEAVEAVEKISTLDREQIRRNFENRFTASRMATDYLAVYRALVGAGDSSTQVRSRVQQPAIG